MNDVYDRNPYGMGAYPAQDIATAEAEESAVRSVNITPTAEGQEAILATFAASILSDVRKARRAADVELLQGIVGLAFGIGFNAAHRAEDRPEDEARILASAVRTRERLEGLVR